MSDTPFFGGGDFLRNLLGDLVRMMPSGAGMQWQLAYQLAGQIASGGKPDANPDPMERIRFEELSAIAELHVAELTGMAVSPSAGSVRLVPASRLEWSRRILEIGTPCSTVSSRCWRRPRPTRTPAAPPAPPANGRATPRRVGALLPRTTSAPSPASVSRTSGRISAAGLGADDLDSEDGEAGMDALFEQWASAMFPAMTAWQVGSVAGHLSETALGPYEVPLAPAGGNELLVVSANSAKVAADWSLPIDDVRLWLCVHEMAYHAVLARPAASERIASLVVEHAQRVRPDADSISNLLQQADPTDMSSFARVLGDPSALLQGEASEALQQVRAELDAVMAAVAGYAEHVTSTIAKRLVGNTTPIGEAMRRRRVSRGDGERAAELLFGLRLDQAQVDRGERFVAGVLGRSGEHRLATMWTAAELLPTPAEVDAPGLWLARLDLPGD